MSIETQHRGYTIRFSENADEWSCLEIEDKRGRSISSPSLSKVKAAIDRVLLEIRKASAFDCFEIGEHPISYRSEGKIEARIIDYVEAKEERSIHGNRNDPPISVKHIVGVTAARRGNDRVSRRNVNIRALMPDTPEAHAAYAVYKKAAKERKAAEKRERDAFDAIPRVTVDMIPDLVRVAQGGDREP